MTDSELLDAVNSLPVAFDHLSDGSWAVITVRGVEHVALDLRHAMEWASTLYVRPAAQT